MDSSPVPETFAKPEDAAQFITVSDPVQHSEGMNKYTSYRVDVRPPPQTQNENNTNPDGTINNNPNINHNPDDVFQNAGYSAVLRRYSDFLWLYERLSKERAGAIIPPLPEKQAVARFSPVFIEERRINLERFLRRVAVHPELYDAACLDTFLRADDVTFQAAKNAKGSSADALAMSMAMSQQNGGYYAHGGAASHMNNPAMSMSMQAPPPPKKDGLKKWFAETKTSISGDLVRSPDDDLFVEIDRYIEGLEKQMKNVQSQASSLVRKNKEIANGLFEFGMAFNILGQSEADDLGHALTNMGSAADQLSNVSMEHSEKEMAQFEEPLKDYLKTIHGVKLALQKRHDKRLTYTTYLSEVNTKRANLVKLRATPGAEAKAYGAEMSLKRGEANADAAREEFATVSQRVLREVDRFKREKGDEMRRVVLDYINLQIDYNKRMEQVWADLLPKLEAVQTNQAGGPSNETGAGDSNKISTQGEVHELSQPQQPPTVYQHRAAGGMNGGVGQNMLGLEGSVQYRDLSTISGM